jgi:hypothetical protein
MYSFAQRDDTTVLDEPFYAFYLRTSGADHPGKDAVMQSQSCDEEQVKREIFSMRDKPVIFIKNMSHHLEVMNEDFLNDVVNVFFIRNPRQILASYSQVIEKPTMRDIGVEYQYNLFNRLAKQNKNPIVLDSNLLLEDPREVLTKLCSHIGITFQKDMLTWPAGPKLYDGNWAPYWYSNVHKTTGFEKQATSSRPLPEHLNELCDQATRLYQKLVPFSLKP